MFNNPFYSLIVISLFFLFSCKSPVETERNTIENTTEKNTIDKRLLNKAVWLIGTWENRTSDGSIYETWEIVNDSVYAGKSYAANDMDTMVFETVQLRQKQENLYYIPSVANQNNSQPVSFKSTSVTENILVFENPEHDFPQKITYTRVNKDSLVAEISGELNGKKGSQTFMMRKIN
jgi:hypothetical protein